MIRFSRHAIVFTKSGRNAMDTPHRTPAILAGIVVAFALGSAGVQAEDKYPSKPVRIVVSFSAGGPTDTVARVMGAKMGDLLGQQFVVENKVGAGGNIGADLVAKAAPDGYTLLMATVSTHAINPGLYNNMPYDPVRDFAPIGQVGVTPTLLGVHPSVPATDVKSLVALIKENPGKFTYGSSGLGSILHLCGEQFKALAGGVNAVHVPYRGSAPMMSDLVGGQISMAFDATPTALPQAQSGAIRAIGAGMAARKRALPELPTVQEQGLEGLRGYTRAADVAGAGIEGLRVLYLERNPRSRGHAAADHRPPQRGHKQSARRSCGVQAPARGRHRSDAGQHAEAGYRVHQSGAGEVGADHQGIGRAYRLRDRQDMNIHSSGKAL